MLTELFKHVRRFFALEMSDRLHTWSPDVNIFGLGLALAALVFGYQPAERPSPFDEGLLLIFTIASGWLMSAGVLQKKPTAEIDERWDDRYDELRDQTEMVLPWLQSSFTRSVWTAVLSRGGQPKASWMDYVNELPIPIPDARPLHEWDYFLRTHESPAVREFFEFAKAAGEADGISNYRRYAVRTYHRFGRLLRAGAGGFRGWFEDEGVKNGAESLVVLLAYLEVARAVLHPTQFRGDGHSGFWYLAQRWHPKTLELPQPTPTEQV